MLPRLVVAGLAGDSGKSLVSLGLVRALRARGLCVAAFKKGPDFIDAAWLGAAAGVPGRNLDTYLMTEDALLGSLAGEASGADLAVVEGNRGIFDGLDARGTHSTAALAKLIGAPVVLVVDVTKCTRTVAALVLGVQSFDRELPIAGVVLNRVGTARQERVIRRAIADAVGLPVLGAVPRWEEVDLPGRHLGLVTPSEHANGEGMLAALGERIAPCLDLDALLVAARAALPLPPTGPGRATDDAPRAAVAEAGPPAGERRERPVRIGVLCDRAFSFYYPENLEALERAGAVLVSIDALGDRELPAIDALYAGGGFPEVHAAALSANASLRAALRQRIADGLPVWAECGGLDYLAEKLVVDGVAYEMVGALAITVEMHRKPCGHGYVEAVIDHDNPFLSVGARLRGHEFHYTSISAGAEALDTVMALERGTGIGAHRDGLRLGNVVACYTHLHALGTPEWAPAFVRVARRAAEPVVRHEPRPPTKPAPKRSGPNAPKTRSVGGIVLGGRGGRSLAAEVRLALAEDRADELARLLATEPRTVRYLLAATYQPELGLRRRASCALAEAGRHHPQIVQNVVRRLIWAMNDESGTNAAHAPEVLCAIAETVPELLLPVIPDLLRLAGEEQFHEGLANALRTVTERCPGRVGAEVARAVGLCSRQGGKGGLATSP
jgi:cobyrinic acid a,c-diamide synthase